MNRSRGLHYTQGSCQFLSAGPLQMVSEHCVACRFETLGLDRNRFDHRIENLFLFSFLKTELFILSSSYSHLLSNLLKISSLVLDDLSLWYPWRHVWWWPRVSLILHGEMLRLNMKHYLHGRSLKKSDYEFKHLEDFEENWRRTWSTQDGDRLETTTLLEQRHRVRVLIIPT